MKNSTLLLKHKTLIKFIGGPHQGASVAAKAHPLAPNGKLPTLRKPQSYPILWKPVELNEGGIFLRNRLSRRFRYVAPNVNEAEQIESGGAEFVY